MADIVIFLTADALTEAMPINNNSDSDNISKTIGIVQEFHIQSALGSIYYNYLKGLVKNVTISNPGNAADKLLLDDYVIPVLMRYSYYKSLRTQSSQLTDKGVQKRRGEASERTDNSEVHALRQDALNDAEFHEKLMIDYICSKGSSVYPKYFECTEESLQPKTATPFNGIHYSEKTQTIKRNRFR